MDELAKHIEQSLKERGFCVVLEDELERCWPSEKSEDAEREEQIKTFAESRGWGCFSSYRFWCYEGNIRGAVWRQQSVRVKNGAV
jgi:hypothetical protein